MTTSAYQQLERRYRRLGALGDAMSILHWDHATTMPHGSAPARAEQMAELQGVSYPTVRGRLDRLIEKLHQEQQRDDSRRQKILQDIEAGRIAPKQGMRMIEAI